MAGFLGGFCDGIQRPVKFFPVLIEQFIKTLLLAAGSGLGFGFYMAVAGFVLYAITTLFTFITLPVEYDASNRALAWLKNKNMLSQQEYAGAEDSLKWAARTYVVAAIGSLAMLVYFGLKIFGGSRD